jgi:uncharacterized membrane protein YcaP (DUF421 family)
VLHGAPYVVVRDGEPVTTTMRSERISMDDLLLRARQQGITRFADIDLAVLETSGQISFFTRHGGDSSKDGAPELEHHD